MSLANARLPPPPQFVCSFVDIYVVIDILIACVTGVLVVTVTRVTQVSK